MSFSLLFLNSKIVYAQTLTDTEVVSISAGVGTVIPPVVTQGQTSSGSIIFLLLDGLFPTVTIPNLQTNPPVVTIPVNDEVVIDWNSSLNQIPGEDTNTSPTQNTKVFCEVFPDQCTPIRGAEGVDCTMYPSWCIPKYREDAELSIPVSRDEFNSSKRKYAISLLPFILALSLVLLVRLRRHILRELI